MDKKNTYFVDIDGTIFVYRKFESYETSDAQVIKSTKQYLQNAKDKGHMIILTTARPEGLRDHTLFELRKANIPFDRLIMGIERGPRYLLNDMDPNNPGDRAICYNLERNGGIKS
tara:strand:- start:380 stop:724 length:345 start_codon:yes stop_codon:yes gene_type:complete